MNEVVIIGRQWENIQQMDKDDKPAITASEQSIQKPTRKEIQQESAAL